MENLYVHCFASSSQAYCNGTGSGNRAEVAYSVVGCSQQVKCCVALRCVACVRVIFFTPPPLLEKCACEW